MTQMAIRVRDLAKCYRLGPTRRQRHLREVIADTLAAPFRRTSRTRLRGRGNGATPLFWALDGVSFDIPQGQVVGLIGRNGAGKSTLLKILARIAEPTRGYGEIEGRVGSLLEVGTGFHPELSGRENIFLNGAILGMKKAEIAAKFEQIVAFSEIEQFLDTPVKRYSSGMYMRLAFAVAAHLEPEILIVDEVLAVGDVSFQKKCLGKMDDVAKEGRTVLFVSHNMGALTRLCSRALWLEKGKLLEDGPAAEVVNHYESQYLTICPEWLRPAALPAAREADFLFLRIAARGAPGQPPGLYLGDQAITIEIDYEVRRPLSGCQIGVRLSSAEGIVTFSSSDADEARVSALPKTPGLFQATFQIPAQFLTPGTYTLHVGAHLPFRMAYDTVAQALVFEVVTSGSLISLDGRLGVVAPLLPWQTHRLEQRP